MTTAILGKQSFIYYGMNDLHIKIKAARKAAHLSQEALGAACNPPVSKAAVGLWETNNDKIRTTPKLENLKTIAKLTKQPIHYFVPDFVPDFEFNGIRLEVKEATYDYETANDIKNILKFVIENQLSEWYQKQNLAQQIDTIMDLTDLLQDEPGMRGTIKDMQASNILRFLKPAIYKEHTDDQTNTNPKTTRSPR